MRCDCDVKFDERIKEAELLYNRETTEYQNDDFVIVDPDMEKIYDKISQHEDI